MSTLKLAMVNRLAAVGKEDSGSEEDDDDWD
jgi:hypothetical protein